MSGPPKGSPQLAQFEVVRRLGEGGMAEVFLARKRGAAGTSKLLVVKRILPHVAADPARRALFIDEALVATRLNHPNLTQVYELVDAGVDGLLMSMEYVEGTDLGRLIHACKEIGERIPFAVSAWVIAEAAKGLHYAHERRDEAGLPLEIVHRDVSPENILLSQEGIVKVTDFGIAGARDLEPFNGLVIGKTRYMAPEQARGESVDRRVDVYALGAILWELLTGRNMFGSLRGDALLELVRSGVVARPSMVTNDVPDDLERIVLGALAPDRKDRFPTARDLATELGRALITRGAWVDGTELESLMRRVLKSKSPSEVPAPVPTEVAVRSGRPPSLQRHVEQRELRQVSLLAVRLVGLFPSALRNDPATQRLVDRFRARLEDIAFKRSAEWTWTGELEARATIGVDENSGKIWDAAALLAIDVHETAASFLDEVPRAFAVSVAMGRAIAEVTLNAKREWVSSRVDAQAEAAMLTLLERVPPGSTWATGSIYRALRHEFAWEPIVLESGSYYALARALSKEERRSKAAQASGDFVGRFAERAELHGALHDASSANGGRGELTTRVLIGERGIGKTALVDAFLHELPASVEVVRFECTPNHVDVQLRSLSALARAALGVTPDMTREMIDERIGEARLISAPYRVVFSKLVHDVDQSGEVVSSSDDVRMMVAAVRALLASRAAGRALVVIVDQAHWLDPTSLSLLPDLLRPGAPTRVLSLLVARPEARIRIAMGSFVTMPISGLSHEELIRVVERRLGVDDGVRQALSHLIVRVDGNPFFMLESVDALLEKGSLSLRAVDGRQLLEQTGESIVELPATVEQVIALRLEELAVSERRAIEWIAVAGVSIDENSLLSLDEAIDAQAVARLCARGICARTGALVEPRQLLFFEVAYAHIPNEARAHMHQTLGQQWLQQAPEGVAPIVVARHLERGRCGSLAGGPFFAAAEQARLAQQATLATKYYRKALQLLPSDDPRHFEARAAIERLLRALGERDSRIAQLSALRLEARALATAKVGAIALVRTAQFELDEGLSARALESVNAAVAASLTASSSILTIEALVLQADILRELGRTADAEAALAHALSMTDGESMRVQRVEVLRALGILRRRAGRVDRAIDAYREALEIAREQKARLQEARINNALSYAMLVSGRYEESVSYAMEAIRIDLEVGGRFQMAKTLTNLGHAAARLGDYGKATEYLGHARNAHARMHDDDGHADTLLVSAEMALEYEDHAAAAKWLAQARTELPKASRYDQIHERIVTAAVSVGDADWASAAKISQGAALLATKVSLFAFEGYSLSILGLACAALGKFAEARIACVRALEIAQNQQMGEFLLEALLAILEATTQFDPALRARAMGQLKEAIAVYEHAIASSSLKQSFRKRPLVRKLLGKMQAPPILSQDEVSPSFPIG